MDFILSVGNENIGFEVKASDRWRSESSKTLHELIEAGKLTRGFGIYLGSERLKSGKITVLPFREFLDSLWNGEFRG